MEFPSDFETSTFPAGKQIAVSRFLAIVITLVFIVIIVMCGLIIWATHSEKIHPFLISTNQITGRWRVEGHTHSRTKEVKIAQTLQESVLVRFVRNWFQISEEDYVNELVWQSAPERSDACGLDNSSSTDIDENVIYCLSSDNVYKLFTEQILPGYKMRVLNGEVWSLESSSLQLVPISSVSQEGGTWQVTGRIVSNLQAPIDFFAIAVVDRRVETYPYTLGYHVTEFNAYKIN